MTPNEQYEMLIDGLRLLAASAEEQLSVLPAFVDVPDEVLSVFSDAYLLVPQLERAKLVGADAATALEVLDDFLAGIPADQGLADPQSLRTHPFWASARALAAEALAVLGEPASPVTLRHVSYVQ